MDADIDDFAVVFRQTGSSRAVLLLDEDQLNHFRSLRIDDPKTNKVNEVKALWRFDETTYNTATSRVVTDKLDVLFGDAGYYLWGAQIIDRIPGLLHPWHADIETCRDGFVSLWIGVEGTNEDTSLHVLNGSHLFPDPIQKFWPNDHAARLDREGKEIRTYSDFPSGATVSVAACGDGEGVFFDGRLWHGTFNRTSAPRRALLLQYGRCDTPVRLPKRFDVYPFEFDTTATPVTTPIRGPSDPVVNKCVRRRPDGGFSVPVATVAARPEPVAGEDGPWMALPYFKVETPQMEHFSCHASVLTPGHMPHTPHRHEDEEVLVVLSGEATIFNWCDRSGALRAETAEAGDVFYYPRGFSHTIANLSVSGARLRYLMFRWTGKAKKRQKATRFKIPTAAYSGGKRLSIDRPSSGLDKVHVHATTLAPGKALPRHVDRYDSAFLVLEGELSVLDKTLGAHGVFLTRAGELHDTANRGDKPCRYLVFEFHAMAR